MAFRCYGLLAVCSFIAGLALPAHAESISAGDIVTNWTAEGPPNFSDSTGGTRDLVPIWTVNGAIVEQTANASGTLVSNVDVGDEFVFSVEITPSPSDDDNIGIVFGWQDYSNHFRLGFEGGGFGDTGGQGSSGARGAYIVSESGGVGTKIDDAVSTIWSLNTTYRFTVERHGTAIDVSIAEVGSSPLYAHSFSSPLFPTGSVGVFTESQTASLGDFAVAVVPEPSSAMLLLIGIAGLAARQQRRTR